MHLIINCGTLPINWNSNRDHDCGWYLLYDRETGQVEYYDYLLIIKKIRD